eukprot:13774002-Heterocapsa_arctica.AAC.1
MAKAAPCSPAVMASCGNPRSTLAADLPGARVRGSSGAESTSQKGMKWHPWLIPLSVSSEAAW